MVTKNYVLIYHDKYPTVWCKYGLIHGPVLKGFGKVVPKVRKLLSACLKYVRKII